jgi:hypothetical protein
MHLLLIHSETCDYHPFLAGLVLDIPYPRLIQQVFESLKPFAGLLTELVHLDCLGNFSFHEKWIAQVFITPLVLCSLAVARYAYVRHRGDETAVKNAAGSLKSDAFFILFVVYRACRLSLLIQLHVCATALATWTC